jgi:hypothetical protein
MLNDHMPEVFVPLHEAATRLGVPAAWLKAQAKAGRVPHLAAGRRILFNVALVQQALLSRASKHDRRDREGCLVCGKLLGPRPKQHLGFFRPADPALLNGLPDVMYRTCGRHTKAEAEGVILQHHAQVRERLAAQARKV